MKPQKWCLIRSFSSRRWLAKVCRQLSLSVFRSSLGLEITGSDRMQHAGRNALFLLVTVAAACNCSQAFAAEPVTICFVDDRSEDGRVLCSHHDDSGRGCATKLLWTRVQVGVLKTLAHTTLAELIEFQTRQLPRVGVPAAPDARTPAPA